MQRVLCVLWLFCFCTAFADGTILKLYRPFGDTVEQIVPVVKSSVNGQCMSQSEVIIREDAWRCVAGGKWYDPCFVKNAGNTAEALCPQSPWTEDSVRIILSSDLSNEQNESLDMSTAYPWGIELTSGEKCQAIVPTELYDGMPIRYQCAENHQLFGYLQRCKEQWSMMEKTPDGVRKVEVSRAWF